MGHEPSAEHPATTGRYDLVLIGVPGAQVALTPAQARAHALMVLGLAGVDFELLQVVDALLPTLA